MLSLKFNLTAEEYFNFTYYNSWSAPEKRRYRISYYLKVFILYFAVAALYVFTNHSSQLLIDFTIFGLIGVVYFLLIPKLIRSSVRRRVRGILARDENVHVLQESEVIISETGIVDRDTLSESRYDWEAIVRKADTSTSYYLYTNSYHAIVIPKRVLSSEQDRLKFQELLNRHLSLTSEFA